MITFSFLFCSFIHSFSQWSKCWFHVPDSFITNFWGIVGLYYGVTISLVSFATGLSVVTLNIHHRGMRGRELPPYLRRFIFGYLAKFLLLKLDMPKRAYLFTGRRPPCRGGGGSKQSVAGDCNSTGASCNNTGAAASLAKASVLGRRLPVVRENTLINFILTL